MPHTPRTRQRAGRKGGFRSARKAGPKNMRLRGHLGGTARMAKLTPEQRSELARKAARAKHAAFYARRAEEQTSEPPLDDDLVT